MKYLLLMGIFLLPSLAWADETITTASVGTDPVDSYGYLTASNPQRDAVYFTPSINGTISSVDVYIRKSNSPTDNLVVALEGTTAGEPSDTPLASGSIGGSGLTTSCVKHTITLSSGVSVTAGTKYWVVFDRSGTHNDTDKYFACGDSTGTPTWTSYYSGAWHDQVSQQLYASMLNVAGGGGGGGGGGGDFASSTASTTSYDNPNLDIFMEIIIFTLWFFGMIFYFRNPQSIIR